MRIGRRWPEGAEPPSEVPEELRARIREAEAARRRSGMPPDAWTLSYLEGSAVVELSGGPRLSLRPEPWLPDAEEDEDLFPGP